MFPATVSVEHSRSVEVKKSKQSDKNEGWVFKLIKGTANNFKEII